MAVYFAGEEYDAVYFAGDETSKALARGQEYHSDTPVDSPGTVTFIAERRLTAFDLRDSDGIVSVQRGVYTFPNTAVTTRPVSERQDAPGVWRMSFRTEGAGTYRGRFEYTDRLGANKVAEGSGTR